MTDIEYKTDILPDRIPVSGLSVFNKNGNEGNHLGDQDLFIMDKQQSESEKQVPTSHVAKSITNKCLEYSFSGDLKIPNLVNDLRILSTKMVGPSAFLSAQVFPRAFQISSLHQDDHKVLDYAEGWWLDEGMAWCMDRALFEYARFKNVSAEWLSSETAKISNLTAYNQFTTNLTAVNLSARNLSSQYAKMSSLTATNLTSRNAWFQYLYNKKMTAENLTAVNLSSHFVSAHHVTTHTIPTGYEAPEGSLKPEDFIGDYSEVVYVSPESYYFTPLMSGKVLICENDEEVRMCLESPFNFKDVYYDWQFGASYPESPWLQYPLCGEVYYDYIGRDYSGQKNWSYKEDLKSIYQSVNTTDYSYYISRTEYSDYDVLIWMRSTANDDDFNGFIAACGKDSKGYLHTLSFVRSTQDGYNGTTSNSWYNNKYNRNNRGLVVGEYCYGPTRPIEKSFFKSWGEGHPDLYTASHWTLAVDTSISSSANGYPWLISSYGLDSPLGPEYGSDIYGLSIENTERDGIVDNIILRNWSRTSWNRSDGTLLSVQRRGNIIKALTTKFKFTGDRPGYVNNINHTQTKPSESELNYLISVDLNNPMFNGDLSVFRGQSSIGFSTHSQAGSFYQIQKFNVPQYIFNTNDQTLKYYPIGNTTGIVVDTDDKYRFIGVGKLVTNPITQKTFYVSSSSVQRVMGLKTIGNSDFGIRFDEEGGAQDVDIVPRVFY